MTTPINRRMFPLPAELLGSGSLVGFGEDLCIDAVTSDGRRVYVSLTEAQAERLATTLERAVAQGFWGDRLPQAILIPHTEPQLIVKL
jgi:hypothetical protein